MMNEDKREALQTFLKFTDDDLIANRAGLLSEQQKKRILTNAFTSLFAFSFAGLGFACLLIVAGQRLDGNILMVSLMLGGPMIIIGVWLWWLQFRDYKQNVVKKAIGVIKFTSVRNGYGLGVADVSLPVVFDFSELLEENAIYKVYYTPSNKGLVSLEKA